MINFFSPGVADKIGYYVYRLIDPRDGQTFYVGKGKSNRVFAHVNGTLKNYEGVDYQIDEDEEISPKIKQILEIKNAGLQVIHVIQRWGMTESEAFEVESALIDSYPGLTNEQGGHSSDRGVCNALSLEQLFATKIYDEPEDFNYIIIKIRWSRVEHCDNSIYEAVRFCWKIRANNAKQYRYVFAVINGVVEGVFKPDEWRLVEDGRGRYEFYGQEAEKDILERFLKKRIPEKYSKKGMASPVLYSKK